jgi:hypothetical protein
VRCSTFANKLQGMRNPLVIGKLLAAVAFPPLLLAAQMTMQITSRQDVLIDPFVADLDGMMTNQPPRDLLRAPVQAQLCLDQLITMVRLAKPYFPTL